MEETLEIRVKNGRPISSYITFALLQRKPVNIVGLGKAINTAVSVSEVLKRFGYSVNNITIGTIDFNGKPKSKISILLVPPSSR